MAADLHTVQRELPTRSLMAIVPHSVAPCPLGPHSSAWPHRLSEVFSLVKLLPFSKHASSSPPDTLCPSPPLRPPSPPFSLPSKPQLVIKA